MHVGDTELRLDAPVGELHHRMHNALRMNENIDVPVRDVEEDVRLEDLETLVHHGRRVHRDLGTHLPAWMGKSLSHGDPGQRRQGTAQEGPARASQDQAAYRLPSLAP